jgi:hypothetical protein
MCPAEIRTRHGNGVEFGTDRLQSSEQAARFVPDDRITRQLLRKPSRSPNAVTELNHHFSPFGAIVHVLVGHFTLICLVSSPSTPRHLAGSW